MSRDLEHLLNTTAATPDRPVDPAEINRLARRRRRRRHAGAAAVGATATAGLVAAVALPLSNGADGTVAEPADAAPPMTGRSEVAQPYSPGFDCPVTEPSPPGFSPPDGYPAEPSGQAHAGPQRPDSARQVWYGTAELWTVLPVDGNYGERKSVWWSNEFPGGREEPRPEIDVTWQRLDTDRVIHNHGDGRNAVTGEDGWFMIAGLDPSEPGCWEVTAQYKGAELSYVYEIPPASNGSDGR